MQYHLKVYEHLSDLMGLFRVISEQLREEKIAITENNLQKLSLLTEKKFELINLCNYQMNCLKQIAKNMSHLLNKKDLSLLELVDYLDSIQSEKTLKKFFQNFLKFAEHTHKQNESIKKILFKTLEHIDELKLKKMQFITYNLQGKKSGFMHPLKSKKV